MHVYSPQARDYLRRETAYYKLRASEERIQEALEELDALWDSLPQSVKDELDSDQNQPRY